MLKFAFFFLFFLSNHINGEVVSGSIKNSEKFQFIGAFCYETTATKDQRGKFDIIFEWNKGTDAQYQDVDIVLYWDAGKDEKIKDYEESWAYNYGNDSLSCEQKTLDSSGGGRSIIRNNDSVTETFTNTQRPHFWYVALANCKAKPLDFTFTAEFVQFNGSQFSFDYLGTLPMYIVFTVIYLIGTGIHLYGDYVLLRNRSLHPIVRVLTISVVLQLVSLLAFTIHWSIYSSNGIGSPVMKFLGEATDMLTQLIFMLELLFISKGWAITHQTLTDKKILLIALAVFFVLYVSLFFWSVFGVNPANALYVYQSVPGVILLVVRVGVLAYFLFNLVKTFRDENDSDKRKFYGIFGGLFTLWFLTLPFTVIIAYAVDPWVRFKTVLALNLIFVTVAQGSLGFLLWPSRASKYFTIAAPDLLGYSSQNL